MKFKLLLILNLVLASLAAGAAHAYPDTYGDGTYMPVGVTLGTDTINGGFAGGEVSIVSFKKVLGVTMQSLLGVYGDYIVSGDTRRISAGPEYGIFPFIFDCGYLNFREDGDTRHGFTVRAAVILFAIPYIRYGRVFGEGTTGNYVEFGVLLKIPVPLP